METSWSRKKTLSLYNQFLHDIYFAVCPYVIQVGQEMESIFTLNFQKDNQIVGQLSTMIYPQIDQHRIQLQPIKNIMFFRIYKDQKMNYKWTLYERNENGKQRLINTVKVSFQQAIDQFIVNLKQTRQNITRSKSFQSKALNSSSKINQSTQTLRGNEKLIQYRKSLQNSITSVNSSSGTTETLNESKNLYNMKQMKGKFPKSQIQVTYFFCIGANQAQITQNIKSFHLESKFNMISKSLKRTDQITTTNKNILNEQNKLQLIEQELQSSQRTTQNPMQIRNSLKKHYQITFQAPQPHQQIKQGKQYPEIQILTINQHQQKSADLQKFTQQKVKQNQININQGQIPNNSVKFQNQKQINQTKQKTLSQLTNRPKTQIHTPQSIEPLQIKHQQDKQLQKRDQLFKTQKTNKKIAFNFDLAHDKQLTQTSPAQNTSQHNPHKTNQTDQSYLKLDDVILNGKRVSVSDKSQWMKTSKSKTSEYEQTQKSHQGKRLNNKSKNQIQNVQSLKNLQLNSKKDDDQSLQLISVKPKQKNGVDNDDNSNNLSNTHQPLKNQDKSQNIVKLNSLLLSDKFCKLKRKSTAQDFHQIQNHYELQNKPKTMQQSTIKKELKVIKSKIKEGGWIDEDLQEQLPTPLFGLDKKSSQKYKKVIPSMIDQAAEIGRSADMSKTNSINEGDPFNIQDDDNFEWGQGLSEIKLIPETQSKNKENTDKKSITMYIKQLQKLSQPYKQKYIKPIKQKLNQNHYYQQVSLFIRQRVNKKHIILLIVIIVLLFVIANVGILYQKQQSLHPDDPIFKKKTFKSKTRITNKGIKSTKKK